MAGGPGKKVPAGVKGGDAWWVMQLHSDDKDSSPMHASQIGLSQDTGSKTSTEDFLLGIYIPVLML